MHAVEPHAVQLVWAHLPARQAAISVGAAAVELPVGPPAWVHHRRRPPRRLSADPGGPGAVTVDGLAAGARHRVVLHVDGRDQDLGFVETPAAPPGRLLSRFATVSDTHVGERAFGAFSDIVDPLRADGGRYPDRCLRAALDEARTWGAELVALKGDLTARSADHEFRAVDRIVAASGLPALYQPGNHDAYRRVDLTASLPAAADVAEGDHLAIADLPGVRVVLVDTSIYRQRQGRLTRRRIDAVADAAASAPGAVVVSLHHPPRRHRVATTYPPGVERPDSALLLAALRRASPRAVVVAGHTHRYRCRRIDGVLVSEVGSTKDYPGGWAGYLVYEGGIVQTVRRTAAPDVVTWTEATGATLGGVWRRWSPGRLADRCWSQTWEPPPG